jgi:hypothetical protein
MILTKNSSSEDIFIEYDQENKKFKLKNQVKIHFFTTQTPCTSIDIPLRLDLFSFLGGDASIFPQQKMNNSNEVIQSNRNFDSSDFTTGASHQKSQMGS